jgi:hypothetical protein
MGVAGCRPQVRQSNIPNELAEVALMYAVGKWNAYFEALIYLNNDKLFPLQIILRQILILNQNVIQAFKRLRVDQMMRRAGQTQRRSMFPGMIYPNLCRDHSLVEALSVLLRSVGGEIYATPSWRCAWWSQCFDEGDQLKAWTDTTVTHEGYFMSCTTENSQDFKSVASTSFATPARLLKYK